MNLPPGEYKNPVERFAQLPEPTRKWLEGLREDNLAEIEDALRFYHSIRAVGRFWKWLLISVAGILVVMSQVGEAMQKLWRLFIHGAQG